MSRVAALLIVLAACAPPPPAAGDACNCKGANPPCGVCDDARNALWCEAPSDPLAGSSSRHFQRFTCPGPAGCTDSASRVVCDWKTSSAGTACPLSHLGLGLCDGTNFLKCEDAADAGTLSLTPRKPQWTRRACSTCTETATTVTCAP